MLWPGRGGRERPTLRRWWPKSNAVYTAWGAVREQVQREGTRAVPMHLRNAPTRLMKGLGHGDGYRYAHDEPGGYAAGEQYLPEALAGRRFYEPVPRGLEQRIGERLAALRAQDAAAGPAGPDAGADPGAEAPGPAP